MLKYLIFYILVLLIFSNSLLKAQDSYVFNLGGTGTVNYDETENSIDYGIFAGIQYYSSRYNFGASFPYYINYTFYTEDKRYNLMTGGLSFSSEKNINDQLSIGLNSAINYGELYFKSVFLSPSFFLYTENNSISFSPGFSRESITPDNKNYSENNYLLNAIYQNDSLFLKPNCSYNIYLSNRREWELQNSLRSGLIFAATDFLEIDSGITGGYNTNNKFLASLDMGLFFSVGELYNLYISYSPSIFIEEKNISTEDISHTINVQMGFYY